MKRCSRVRTLTLPSAMASARSTVSVRADVIVATADELLTLRPLLSADGCEWGRGGWTRAYGYSIEGEWRPRQFGYGKLRGPGSFSRRELDVIHGTPGHSHRSSHHSDGVDVYLDGPGRSATP